MSNFARRPMGSSTAGGGVPAPSTTAGRHNAWRDSTRERNEQAQRRAVASGGGGGGGGNVEAWPLHIKDKTFWPPEGIPVPHASEAGKIVLPGKETYLKALKQGPQPTMTVILLGAHQFAWCHSPQVFRDESVLPKRLVSAAQKNRDVLKSAFFGCTFDAKGLKGDDYLSAYQNEWSPNSKWEEVDEGVFFLEGPGPHFNVEVTHTNAGFEVAPPTAHRFALPEQLGPFETLEEAMWNAESLVAQAASCGFCAQKQVEHVERWGRNDTLVFDARQAVLLPMFSLNWLFGAPSDKEREAGYFRMGEEITMEPEGNEIAIREGFVWLRGFPKKTNKGSGYRTFENYATYMAQLACTCTNCLGENGEKLDARTKHVIQMRKFQCEHCGTDLIDPRVVSRAQIFREAPEDENTGVKDWTKAGWFQLANEFEGECPHCRQRTIGRPVLECSSCDRPTPMLPHQTLTHVSKDVEGGYYRFDQMIDEETGRIFYPDWSHLPTASGGDVLDRDKKKVVPSTVEGVLAPAVTAVLNGRFHEFLDMSKSKSYPQLTPRQQAQLIGSEVFTPAAPHSEPR